MLDHKSDRSICSPTARTGRLMYQLNTGPLATMAQPFGREIFKPTYRVGGWRLHITQVVGMFSNITKQNSTNSFTSNGMDSPTMTTPPGLSWKKGHLRGYLLVNNGGVPVYGKQVYKKQFVSFRGRIEHTCLHFIV